MRLIQFQILVVWGWRLETSRLKAVEGLQLSEETVDPEPTRSLNRSAFVQSLTNSELLLRRQLVEKRIGEYGETRRHVRVAGVGLETPFSGFMA